MFVIMLDRIRRASRLAIHFEDFSMRLSVERIIDN